MNEVSDPEDVIAPRTSDIEEAVVDEIPDDERPEPLEAEPADVVEQRIEISDDDERDPDY